MSFNTQERVLQRHVMAKITYFAFSTTCIR